MPLPAVYFTDWVRHWASAAWGRVRARREEGEGAELGQAKGAEGAEMKAEAGNVGKEEGSAPAASQAGPAKTPQ